MKQFIIVLILFLVGLSAILLSQLQTSNKVYGGSDPKPILICDSDCKKQFEIDYQTRVNLNKCYTCLQENVLYGFAICDDEKHATCNQCIIESMIYLYKDTQNGGLNQKTMKCGICRQNPSPEKFNFFIKSFKRFINHGIKFPNQNNYNDRPDSRAQIVSRDPPFPIRNNYITSTINQQQRPNNQREALQLRSQNNVLIPESDPRFHQYRILKIQEQRKLQKIESLLNILQPQIQLQLPLASDQHFNEWLNICKQTALQYNDQITKKYVMLKINHFIKLRKINNCDLFQSIAGGLGIETRKQFIKNIQQNDRIIRQATQTIEYIKNLQ